MIDKWIFRYETRFICSGVSHLSQHPHNLNLRIWGLDTTKLEKWFLKSKHFNKIFCGTEILDFQPQNMANSTFIMRCIKWGLLNVGDWTSQKCHKWGETCRLPRKLNIYSTGPSFRFILNPCVSFLFFHLDYTFIFTVILYR